tara:strand:+ start:849 stop:1052 length:204 start_codon:yes stop_codon:yes gene_type:complete
MISEKTYTKELKKDIGIIKKDLRAVSIKLRIIARELDIEKPVTQPKVKKTWIKSLLITIKRWFHKDK